MSHINQKFNNSSESNNRIKTFREFQKIKTLIGDSVEDIATVDSRVRLKPNHAKSKLCKIHKKSHCDDCLDLALSKYN